MEIKTFTSLKAFIRHQDKIFILRESSKYIDGTNTGKYGLPGGRVKPGEHFMESLRREIYEETGLSVRIGKPFSMNEWRPVVKGEQWHIIATFVECFADSDNVILSTGHNHFLWIDPQGYKKYNHIETNLPAFEDYTS